MVRTAGPNGAPHDCQIKYTFGVSPLSAIHNRVSPRTVSGFRRRWDSRPPARAAANAGLRFIQAPSFSCPARCTGPRTSRPGTRCARTVIRPMCARTTIQRRAPLQRRLRKSMSGGATARSNLDQSCFSGREIWRGRQWRVRRMKVMASFVAPRVGIGCRVVAEGMLPLFRARQFPVTAGPPGP
jgi:hypothetical protein